MTNVNQFWRKEARGGSVKIDDVYPRLASFRHSKNIKYQLVYSTISLSQVQRAHFPVVALAVILALKTGPQSDHTIRHEFSCISTILEKNL